MPSKLIAAAALAALAAVTVPLAIVAAPAPRHSAVPAPYAHWRPGEPVAACLAPDADFTLAERLALDALLGGPEAGLRYQSYRSWGNAGEPRVITWSLVPDGTNMDYFTGGDITADTFAKFDSIMPRAQWIGIIEDCIQRWGALSGIEFRRVSVAGKEWDDGIAVGAGTGGTSTRGDIRIGAGYIDGYGGVLGLGFYPSTGDLLLDSGDLERWARDSGDYRGLRNALMHEMGHNLGAMHLVSTTHNFLMEPWINGSFYGPQHDDIRYVHNYYGDVFEPNDSASAAVELGTIRTGQSVRPTAIPAYDPGPEVDASSTASIHAADDSDFYEITIDGPADVTFILQPLGFSQTSGPQGGSESQFDSSRMANLLLDYAQIGGGKGTRVNKTGLGQPETLSLSFGPGSSTVQLAVRASSFDDTQLYDLIVSAGGYCPADLSTTNADAGKPGWGEPDGTIDGADLSYYIEAWVTQSPAADLTTEHVNPGEPGYGFSDGSVDGADLSYYVELWLAGCV